MQAAAVTPHACFSAPACGMAKILAMPAVCCRTAAQTHTPHCHTPLHNGIRLPTCVQMEQRMLLCDKEPYEHVYSCTDTHATNPVVRHHAARASHRNRTPVTLSHKRHKTPLPCTWWGALMAWHSPSSSGEKTHCLADSHSPNTKKINPSMCAHICARCKLSASGPHASLHTCYAAAKL